MHSLTKDSLLLSVLPGRVGTQHGTEVVVIHLAFVCVNEATPPLLAGLALHLILVDGGLQVVVGELFEEMLVDDVVDLREAQLRAGELLEDGPVGCHVLDDCIPCEYDAIVVHSR